MARSTNFVDPEVYRNEFLRQSVLKFDVFNQATGGAIRLVNIPGEMEANGGTFNTPVRFKRNYDLAAQNDEANPATAATPTAIVQGEGVNPRSYRRLYTKATYDEIKTGFYSSNDYSAQLGRQYADEMMTDLRKIAIAAAVASVDSADTTDGTTASADIHVLDLARGSAAGSKVTATLAYLNRMLYKMGDAQTDIISLIAPSQIGYDLKNDSMSSYVTENVAGFVVNTGMVATLGRPLLEVDDSSLSTTLTSSYYTERALLGLGVGAITVKVVEIDEINEDYVDSTQIPYWTWRQNYIAEVEVLGMKWKTTVNPTITELGTAANWDENYENHREFPIVKLVVNSTL